MRRSSGFTMMELLMVAAIIALLAALLLPSFTSVREKGQQVVCINNQRQIALDISIWTQDHGETYPEANTAWQDIDEPAKLLRCPTQDELFAGSNDSPTDTAERNDYAYSSFVAGKAISKVQTPAEEMLTADAAPAKEDTQRIPAARTIPNIFNVPSNICWRHNGYFIAGFCDGHVELQRELPPLWIIQLTDMALFQQEILSSKYPALVIFGNMDFNQGVTSPADTSSAVSSSALSNFTLSRYICGVIARNFRGRVKIMWISPIDFPMLADRYQVTQNGGYPLAVLFMAGGREKDRFIARPGTIPNWQEQIWTKACALLKQ